MCHRFTCKPLLSFLDLCYDGIFPWRMHYFVFVFVCVCVCVSMCVYLTHVQNDAHDVYNSACKRCNFMDTKRYFMGGLYFMIVHVCNNEL